MNKFMYNLKDNSYIYIYIYRSALALLFVLLSTLITSGFASAQDVPTSVTIKPSLGVTVSSSDLTLDLDPATKPFDKQSITINVGTNNAHGYSLTMNSTGTDLVNIVDSSEAIATLEESTTEASFPANKWGYRLDSGNFLPYSSGTVIGSASGITNNDTYNLTVASKVDYMKDAGSYRLDIDLRALPHVTQYYMQDFATDASLKNTVCTTEPTMVMDSRDGHTYAIAKLADGKCWMLQNLRLGEGIASVSGELVLTEQDTNISSTDTINGRATFTLTNKVADGKMPYKRVTDPDVTDGYGYIWDGPAFYCTDAYGCYYNYYTATAGVTAEGTGAVTTRATDVPSTICPKGWTMPTGGDHQTTAYPSHVSDFRLMVNAYGYGVDAAATVATRLLVDPTSATENINGANAPGLLLGGGYSSGGASNVGVYGSYWSRTVFSYSHGSNLNLNTTAVNPANHNNKNNGRSVRCVAQ